MDFKSLPEKVKEQIRSVTTPAFIFDYSEPGKQYNYLDSLFIKHLPENFRKRWVDETKPDGIYYALKCNSDFRIINSLVEPGCGLEVNNMPEMQDALDQGVEPSKIINSMPITPSEDIKEMYAAGCRYFCVDSDDQVDNIAINAPDAKIYFRLFITHHGADLDLSRRLGLTCKSAPEVIRYTVDKGLDAHGITFHVGSQCGDKSDWQYGIGKARDLFNQFPQLNMLNVGGGLPITYNKRPENSPEDIVKEICNSVEEHFGDKDITFQVEPGRYLVAGSAITVTSVTGVNSQRTPQRVVVDQSLYTGLVEKLQFDYDFQYPIQTESNGSQRINSYAIIGPTCDGTDVIAEEARLRADLKSNHIDPLQRDRIYLLNTGGYTLDYTPRGNLNRGFNKAVFPDVYMIKNEELIPVNVKEELAN